MFLRHHSGPLASRHFFVVFPAQFRITPECLLHFVGPLIRLRIIPVSYTHLDVYKRQVYGRGQWASSLRYHDGRFYVWFSPNDDPHRGYIYTAEDPAGEWTLLSRPPHHHDASLFFDDDGKVYLFYGTGQLRQLKSDLSDVEPGGIDQKIFERDADEQGLLEGSKAFKLSLIHI